MRDDGGGMGDAGGADPANLAERFDLLGEALRSFAEASAEPRLLLETVVGRTARALGGLCCAALVSVPRGQLELAALFHPDPARLQSLAPLARMTPLPLDSASAVAACLAGREPVILRDVAPADLQKYITDAREREILVALHIQQVVVTPLRAGGESLGLLVVIRHGPNALPFAAADLRLAQNLADHAALALTHARTLERAQGELAERRRAESRLRLMMDLAREFAAVTNDYQALLAVVARRLAEIIGEGCVLRLVADGGEWLEMQGGLYHPDPKVVELVRESMLNAPLRVGQSITGKVVATGTPILVPDIDPERVAAMTEPRFRPLVMRLGVRSMVAVPLRSQGTVIGVVALLRLHGGNPYNDEDLRLLEDVASHAALAISNARLYAASQRELAEREKAEQALRRTEEQLRHSQKMEAVGRLAGGVAHDFNNLLSVVLSYSSLLIDELAEGNPMRGDLQEILKAAQRAAQLTRQLLAFSRQQVLAPRVLDLNAVIANMEKLIRRLIGENIVLQMECMPGLRRIKADPGRIEQVIMNLVVNARDAMPAGGALRIVTAMRSIDSVILSVHDTGSGMDAATQQRIFEPFFTTKEHGKGTGLGLSTVFGIVQQSGGTISVTSEPMRGSVFEVCLPATSEIQEPTPPPPAVITLRGTETLLLVEDEDQVRAVAKSVLEHNGYRILEARDGGDALRICASTTTHIDLLLTDLVMPGMSGRELAERLVPERPGMRVLYMSGYTDDAAVHHGLLVASVSLLAKPLTPELLLHKVREVLDAPRTPDRPSSHISAGRAKVPTG